MKKQEDKHFFDIKELLAGLGTAVLKSIRDPFGIIAPDYTILWLNKAMAFIHGGRHEDAVGNICYHFFYGAEDPCEDCPLEEVFATSRTQISERHLDFPDGQRRWGEVKVYPVWGEDRSVVAAFVLVFDITDRKKKAETQKQYSKYLSKQLNARSGSGQTIYLDDGDIAVKTSLSSREKEVLRLLTEGYTNTQISEMLSISPHTVKSHVINIFNKLGVSDRTQAAVLAIRYQLL
ncbi:LuxR C-terminal-related transcriptional regulator [Thermodesulfobacteriota bacterium]